MERTVIKNRWFTLISLPGVGSALLGVYPALAQFSAGCTLNVRAFVPATGCQASSVRSRRRANRQSRFTVASEMERVSAIS